MNKNDEWGFIEKIGKYVVKGEVLFGKLEDFSIYDAENLSRVDNIYRGRVTSKVPGLKAIFVDIGLEKDAFLQLDAEDYKRYAEGDDIIVQILHEGEGEKGDKVTLKYELKGKYAIIQPFENRIKISKKIKGEDNKKSLLKIFENSLSDDMGAVIRTDSEFATKEEIKDEIKKNLDLQNRLAKEKNYKPTPKLLVNYNSISNLLELSDEIEYVTNSETIFYNYKEHKKIYMDKEFKIRNIRFVFDQIKELFSNKVELENGIELVIESTEAFNVIDVNSSGLLHKNAYGKDIIDANFLICKDLIKQIIFRNLCGIILIDLINFGDNKREIEFIKYFESIANGYTRSINVVDITKLGILELTRSRKSKSLKLSDLKLDIFFEDTYE